MRAVIYAAKSSPDEKGSVADQQEQVRQALPDDREVIGVFGEENASGYRKERGPQLEAAMRIAIQAAEEDGEAELWVWHSSRLARGDGRKGKRSIQLVVAQLLYENVIVRSVGDPEMVTPMLSGIASTVSNKYSEDLSTHVKRGLRQRKEEGKPCGPVPFGYRAEPIRDEHGDPVIKRQRVINERVIDPVRAPVVGEVYQRFAGGESTGDLARWLNAQGYRTIRDKPWNADAVRWMLENDSYLGRNGYSQIIDEDLAERARSELQRTDPVARQRRKGGRPPKSLAVLRGIGHCTCGAPMYCLSPRYGLPRRYLCRNVHQNNGLCDRPPIPADAAEDHVLHHLDWFVGDLDRWARGVLSQQSAEHAGIERQLEMRRGELADLDGQREARAAELESVGFHPVALEVIERMDRRREAMRADIGGTEAQLAEWTAEPTVDGLLDFYNALRDLVAGRVKRARGAAELNAALAEVLAGVWMEIDASGLLRADFELRRRPETEDVLASMLPTGVRLPTYGAPKGPSSHTSTRWSP